MIDTRNWRWQLTVAISFVIVMATRCASDGSDGEVDFPATSGFESTSSTERISPAKGTFITGAGPTQVADAIAQRFGREVQLFEVTLHETHASMRVRDPAQPENVDDYSYRDGVIGDPRPVHTSPRDDLDAQTFRFGAVKWEAITGLVATAVDRLKIEDGAPSHVIVDRNEQSPDGVVIRVYVNGPRRSGYLEATGAGAVTRVEQS